MNSIYEIWFARIPIANSIKKKLYNKFKLEDIYFFDKEIFTKLGLRWRTIEQILSKKYRENLEKYIYYMDKNDIKLIFCNDKRYPSKLKIIFDSPTYLFLKRKFGFA